MKNFEFKIPNAGSGGGGSTSEGMRGKPGRPMSGRPGMHPPPAAARGAGGGFFGGFGTSTKNKKATISKEEQEMKDQKLK